MTARALVLSGGGPVGIAWETGLAAGLAQEGVDLAQADLIIGTSAGAVVGAQLALGRSPPDMLARQIDLGAGAGPAQRAYDISPLVQIYARFYATGTSLDAFRHEVGALALQAETMSEDERTAMFGQLVDIDAWPERLFRCTAIDAADGSFVAWDKGSGVKLIDALVSSCAVPGVFPPVTIAGRRYMDGGMGSLTNATLAGGYEGVLVVAFAGSASGDFIRRRLEAELDALRQAGSAVEVIFPDAPSLAALGPNMMDARRRTPAAQAGERQGRAEAPRVAAFWQAR
jgi:NTE family protein